MVRFGGRCRWVMCIEEFLPIGERRKRGGGVERERDPIGNQGEVSGDKRVHDVEAGGGKKGR